MDLSPPTYRLWEDRQAALQEAGAVTQELLAARLAELGYSTMEACWLEDLDQPNRRVCGELVRPDGSREDPERELYCELDGYLADLTGGEDLMGTQDGPYVAEIAAAPGDVEALKARYEKAWRVYSAAQKAALTRSWDDLRRDVQTVAPGATRLLVQNVGDEWRVHEVWAAAVIEADGTRRELTGDQQDLLNGHLSYLTGYDDPLPYADVENRRRFQCEVDVSAPVLPVYVHQSSA